MNEYDEECVQIFLERQLQLFPEKVAESYEEAEYFLEDCMAVVCADVSEVIDYLSDGMDISGMSEKDVLAADEVFALPSGRYLIVEG